MTQLEILVAEGKVRLVLACVGNALWGNEAKCSTAEVWYFNVFQRISTIYSVSTNNLPRLNIL